MSDTRGFIKLKIYLSLECIQFIIFFDGRPANVSSLLTYTETTNGSSIYIILEPPNFLCYLSG